MLRLGALAILSITMAVSCGCGATHRSAADDAQTEQVGPGSPEEAVARLDAAHKSGDLEQVEKAYGKEYGPIHVGLRRAAARVNESRKQLVAALQAQFGVENEEGDLPGLDPYATVLLMVNMSDVVSLSIVDKTQHEDGYKLMIKSSFKLEDIPGDVTWEWLAIKTDNGWQVLPKDSLSMDRDERLKRGQNEIDYLNAVAGIYEQVAQNVKSGNLTSVDAAYGAAKRALREHEKNNGILLFGGDVDEKAESK